MRRKRKIVVLSANSDLQNTLFNAINTGIDNFNPNYIPTGGGGSNYVPPQSGGTTKPVRNILPEFNNPFGKIKIPDITVSLEPDTKKMIDYGIKTLSGAIIIHGLLVFFKRK